MSKEKINPLYRLDNFIVGKSNQFAYNTIQNITESNFLVLYGKNGTGKTHLLWAIKNFFIEENKSVVYTTSEMFLNDMVNHIKHFTMEKFRNKYRNCDLLLIDDIQFFSGKEGIQEEFYHTIEARKLAGKETILVSSKNPKHLASFSEYITSQLLGALSINIELPNQKTMIAIAKQKCLDNDIVLNKKTIDFLVNNCAKNINHLNGMILKLKAYSTLMVIDIDFKTSKKILKDEICIRKNKKTNLKDI